MINNCLSANKTLNRIFKVLRFAPHFENWLACRYISRINRKALNNVGKIILRGTT